MKYVEITEDFEKMKTKKVRMRWCSGEPGGAFEIDIPKGPNNEWRGVEMKEKEVVSILRKAGYLVVKKAPHKQQ